MDQDDFPNGTASEEDRLLSGEASNVVNELAGLEDGAPSGDDPLEEPEEEPFDYTYVSATARIALYDDLRSAPHIIEIHPAETGAYIESLASKIYEQAKAAGGAIPYTVIREVSENFIHARFKEIVVSILDHGNTIRFADQGPGIHHKDRAQLPGFSSAIEPMKSYIRGVGSGLPIVKEYLEFSHGTINIEDNMGAGSVVTISLNESSASAATGQPEPGFADMAAAGDISAFSYPGASEGTPAHQEVAPHQHPAGTPGGFSAEAASMYAPATQQPAAQQFSSAGMQPYGQQHPAASAQQPGQAYPNVGGASYGTEPAQGGYGYPQAGTQFPGAMPGYPAGYQADAAAGYYPQPVGHPAGNYGGQAYPQAGDPMSAASFQAYEMRRIQMVLAPLSQRERDFLPILLNEGPLGVTDLSRLTDTPGSSTYVALQKLEQAGLVEKAEAQKRKLTPFGRDVARSI